MIIDPNVTQIPLISSDVNTLSTRLEVVLIDDQEDALFLTKHALQSVRPECNVVKFQDPARALSHLRVLANESLPDAIFVDLNMPVVDGFEVLRQLRRNPAYACVPTIILSTSDRPGDVEVAFRLGAAGYFLKNLRPLDAQLAMSAATRIRAGLSPALAGMPGMPRPSYMV